MPTVARRTIVGSSTAHSWRAQRWVRCLSPSSILAVSGRLTREWEKKQSTRSNSTVCNLYSTFLDRCTRESWHRAGSRSCHHSSENDTFHLSTQSTDTCRPICIQSRSRHCRRCRHSTRFYRRNKEKQMTHYMTNQQAYLISLTW